MSYSLRETRAVANFGLPKGVREVSHQIDSFVERVQPVGRSAPFSSARGILGLELLGEEDLFKRCPPKIIRSFAFEVLNDEDPAAPEDVAARWAGMQAALFEAALARGGL